MLCSCFDNSRILTLVDDAKTTLSVSSSFFVVKVPLTARLGRQYWPQDVRLLLIVVLLNTLPGDVVNCSNILCLT